MLHRPSQTFQPNTYSYWFGWGAGVAKAIAPVMCAGKLKQGATISNSPERITISIIVCGKAALRTVYSECFRGLNIVLKGRIYNIISELSQMKCAYINS